MSKLVRGNIVRSPVSGRRYRLGSIIGHGGYGKAFEAVDLRKHRRVCLKYTFDQMSWHRESYFGELLEGNRRVIQTYDSFPIVPGPSGRGRVRYCLVLELAEHGAMADYLARTQRPWPEDRAKREVMALLRLLDQLHGGSATHRDITPFNIFVCRNGVLKLGDFGIARHALAGQATKPDAFNPDYVTRGFLEAEHRAWTTVDDVFQMGQLLTMLLLGELRERPVRVRDLQQLDVSSELKRVIKRAIGPRSRRYRDAWEMLQALRGDAPPSTTRLRSLRDRTVVFSGPMSLSRFDAEVLAIQAGARVAERVTKQVDVFVQGRRRSKEGSRPTKLAQAERLHRQGHSIQFIGEAEFRRLARVES